MGAESPASAWVLIIMGLVGSTPALAEEHEALPSPLRLEQVIGLARSARPEIVAAQARARAAREHPHVVSALEDPTVTVAVGHLPFSLQGANWSVAVQQGLPLSRIRGHRRHAAELAADSVRAGASRVVLDVELDAAHAFLLLWQRRETRRILEEQRRLAVKFVASALARYSAGTGIQADVLRAEIEVARFDGLLGAIEAEVQAAEATLNTSLGRPADLPVPPLQSAAQVAAPPDVAAVRQAAFARRPELRQGRAEVDRARAEVSVMKSMYAPMAMVGTGPAYTMMDGYGWMFMVGLRVPIWLGRLRAGVAEARGVAEMAQAELEATTRMVDGSAVGARALVAAARARFLSLRDEIVPRAEQAIEPSIAGYSTGRLPLVSVIDAAQALWSSQAELVRAEADLGLAWARLGRATAKGSDGP